MSRGAEKTRVPLLMRDRSFYHTFLILAGTLILEQAVVLSVNLADNLMIGSYNETALAAVDSSQVRIVADLSNITSVGTYPVPVKVYVDADGVGVVGEYSIVVNVSR